MGWQSLGQCWAKTFTWGGSPILGQNTHMGWQLLGQNTHTGGSHWVKQLNKNTPAEKFVPWLTTVTRDCCVLPEMGELGDPLLTLPVDVGHSLPGTLKQHGLKLLKVLVHRAGCLPVKLLQQNTMGAKVETAQKERSLSHTTSTSFACYHFKREL